MVSNKIPKLPESIKNLKKLEFLYVKKNSIAGKHGKYYYFGISLKYYTLIVRSRRKQLVLFSRESWCFPRRSRGKHQGSRENKTNWLPEEPDIKCFVIFLDFHFNNNKRITGANQNSRLGTYNITNLILDIAEWMIYKVHSLYYLRLFPPLATVFLLRTFGITLKLVAI